MRLGLVARADSRGLGIQTWEFYRNLKPDKTIVINCPSAKPLPLHLDRFPGATFINGWPTPADYSRFLTGLDAVYTAETPYHNSLFSIAEAQGIRSALHVNPEFCDKLQRPNTPDPSIYLAPTTWMFNELPEPKRLQPFPVATDRFMPVIAERATRFLHVIGRPAIWDRNGTVELLYALESVKSELAVTITCQEPGYVESLINEHAIHIPNHVGLHIDSRDIENYWDIYTNQHVLVLPRKFGGMSLPMQEACAAGMPVIATDISPNHDWLPTEWLVPAHRSGDFMARTKIDLYSADILDLAAMIDLFASSPTVYRSAAKTALDIADSLSWREQGPRLKRLIEQ